MRQGPRVTLPPPIAAGGNFCMVVANVGRTGNRALANQGQLLVSEARPLDLGGARGNLSNPSAGNRCKGPCTTGRKS